MFTRGFVRRAAVAAFGASALVAAIAGQSALAQSGLGFRDVRVDVSPLRSTAGDPTAAWVQLDLSAQLAQALAGRIAPNGATLTVRIDYLTLSSGARVDCGSSRDNISGVAIIGFAASAGARVLVVQRPLKPRCRRWRCWWHRGRRVPGCACLASGY